MILKIQTKPLLRVGTIACACLLGACLFDALSMLPSLHAAEPTAPEPTAPEPESAWSSLFDGKTLSGWKVTNFGGEGEVYVENERLIMDFGSSLTGITLDPTQSKLKLPTSNYEIQLEAQRVDGGDFFCGLTFPVDQSHCSLIVGGWGGALVGLSSLDGKDAARNETQVSMPFKRGQWYRILLRVKKDRIQVWIDGKQVINQSIAGRKLSIRPEVELSKPLGFCTWETRAALRKIQLRALD